MRQVSSLEFLSDDRNLGVKIGYQEVLQILKICKHAGTTEVGGIVIGCYDPTHSYALIKTISNAPPDSFKERDRFQRGVRGLQELLDNLWCKKQFFYLGEWHFHPSNSSCASSLDIKQMKAIAMSASYNCPEPLLLICCGDLDEYWELSAYVFPRNQASVKLIEVIR